MESGICARQYLFSLSPSARSLISASPIIKLPYLGVKGRPKYLYYTKSPSYFLLRAGPNSRLLLHSKVRMGCPSRPTQEADKDTQIETLDAMAKDKHDIGVKYVRHGREFLLGVGGSREVVEKLKARIAQFLRTDLHLDVGLTSHVHIQSGSVVFLGVRVAGVLEDRWPKRYSQELEKRRRSKARVRRMAEMRTETWNNELKDLSLQAWAFGLKKTKQQLRSWEAAEQAMYKKAQGVCCKFVFDQIERGETQQSLQRLLEKEEDIFYDAPGTGIPAEIIRAHRRLSRLLEKYLEEETAYEKKMKLQEKNQPSSGRTPSQGGIPLQLLAPMEVITQKLRKKGILQPSKALPTVLTTMLNSSDEAIVSYFASIGNGLLSYYRCCDNFLKIRRLVDHQVRWSALFTLASKHGCSAKKIIKSHSRGPRVLNTKGGVIAEFPSTPEIARMGKKFLAGIQPDAVDDILRSTSIQLVPRKMKNGLQRVELRE